MLRTSRTPAKEANSTLQAGNQGSSVKSRSMLSRTIVLVLNPLSDASSTPVYRLNCKKIGRIFEDFKKCNQYGINVLLRDAVDDIDLVGWISPFTLLIHGSSEDMDTIEQAWVGRMLKPPKDFLIKDFGEMSSVNMKQIPQSQFISICETLHQIITSLNENQIRATLECVLSRLCSSFDSVVIPPLSAVKRSLDLLVEEKKIDIIDGSYYVRNTKNSHMLSKTFSVPEPYCCIQESKNQALKNENIMLLSDKTTRKKVNKKESKTKDPKTLKVKERVEITRKDNQGLDEKRNTEAKLIKKNIKQNKQKKDKSKKHQKQRSKPHLKSRKVIKCISQTNYSEFINQDASGYLESENLTENKNKQAEKRLSFFRKLSRLFKKTSTADEDDLVNQECQSESEHQCTLNDSNDQMNDDDDVRNHEQTKIVSGYCKVKQEMAKSKKKKFLEKEENKENNTTNFIGKQSDKKDREDFPKRRTSKQVNRRNKFSASQKEDFAVVNPESTKYERYCRLPAPPLSYSCSSSECNRTLSKKNILKINSHNSGGTKKELESTNRDLHYNHSSWSEISDSSNSNNSNYSFSSNASSELIRRPLHYSSTAINDDPRQKGAGRDTLNFCSTQAICGDLEMSSLSLHPATACDARQRTPLPPSIDEGLIYTAQSQPTPFNHQNRQTGDERSNELPTRNLQLIGVL